MTYFSPLTREGRKITTHAVILIEQLINPELRDGEIKARGASVTVPIFSLTELLREVDRNVRRVVKK